MGVSRSLLDGAACRFDGFRRNLGRFFYALLIPAAACAAPQWDVVVEADPAGNVRVLSQRAVDAEPSPPQPLAEGLTCLELRDETGALLDRRAAPLAGAIYHDEAGPDGALSGGPVAGAGVPYHVRLPRRAGARLRLSFFAVRRRAGAGAARAAGDMSGWALEPRGHVLLEDRP